MFDVDKLKEAVANPLPYRGSAFEQIEAAVCMVVAGQPLWWCEEHKEWPLPEGDWSGECRYSRVDYAGDCRMVEGWWMPTGKDET